MEVGSKFLATRVVEPKFLMISEENYLYLKFNDLLWLLNI